MERASARRPSWMSGAGQQQDNLGLKWIVSLFDYSKSCKSDLLEVIGWTCSNKNPTFCTNSIIFRLFLPMAFHVSSDISSFILLDAFSSLECWFGVQTEENLLLRSSFQGVSALFMQRVVFTALVSLVRMLHICFDGESLEISHKLMVWFYFE